MHKRVRKTSRYNFATNVAGRIRAGIAYRATAPRTAEANLAIHSQFKGK